MESIPWIPDSRFLTTSGVHYALLMTGAKQSSLTFSRTLLPSQGPMSTAIASLIRSHGQMAAAVAHDLLNLILDNPRYPFSDDPIVCSLLTTSS
jgi:hypothetical protein